MSKYLKKEVLYKIFKEEFPNFAKDAVSYKKVGSRAISIKFKNRHACVFLYNGTNDFTFGTYIWRKRPTPSYSQEKQNI